MDLLQSLVSSSRQWKRYKFCVNTGNQVFLNTHSARSSNSNIVFLFPKPAKKHYFTNETVLLNSAIPNSSSKSKQRTTNLEIYAAVLAFAEHL